jgi:glutamine amidotransferase
MCELLGMSANVPTDICFSFSGLVKRGGDTGPHKDGWGITFYEGKGCRSFKDPQPSCNSKIAELVKQYPIKSKAVISHIRQANRGGVSLENTHPFTRELWGKNWTYAHNGQLTGYQDLTVGRNLPVGQTDSERAFCWIIEQLIQDYDSEPEDKLEMFRRIAGYADRLREMGVFNMLLSNGEHLFCYCSNNLHWLTRRAPFGKAQLIDEDMTVDFQKETSASDVVTVIATRPLTKDEQWHKMAAGEYCLFYFGDRVL